jgi:adenylate cyclase
MNGEKKRVPTPPLSSGKSLVNSAADPVPATAVRDQLARVVNSPGFVSSVRLCRFLTHMNRTIDGDIDSLKEFSIAMEVFDRTSEYDPNIDAIVRVEARRLRAKLKAYYEQGQGLDEPFELLAPLISQVVITTVTSGAVVQSQSVC